MRSTFSIVACSVALIASQASAGSVVLTPSSDNSIYSESTQNSNGAGPSVVTGNNANGAPRRALVRFDLAAGLPVGAMINSAQLTMHITRTTAGPTPVALHRLIANWGEGSSYDEQGGGGTLATPEVATWTHRYFGSTLWNAPGGDCFTPASATATAGATGTSVVWSSNPLLVGDVQNFMINPGQNFGWALIGDETTARTAKRFGSRENPDPAVRPALTINYTPLTQAWNLDASGDWFSTSNWIGGTPNSIGALAHFGNAITLPRTVTLAAPSTVGILRFDNFASYTITGIGTLTLNDASGPAQVDVATGSHSIDAPTTFATDTTINVGSIATLKISNLQTSSHSIIKSGSGLFNVNRLRAAGLTINSGTVNVLPNGADAAASRVGTLSLATDASLDLNDNDLIATASSLATIEAAISQARNGGAWDQPGLTSSAAAASPELKTLGAMTGADYSLITGNSSFAGIPIVSSDILVKHTWYGDADFSGAVDFDDYVRIDTGFNLALTGFCNGDFNFDHIVDFDDYVLIDTAFNGQNGTLIDALNWLSGADRSAENASLLGVQRVIEHANQFGDNYANGFIGSIPEPATVALLAFACLPAWVRRGTRGAPLR